MIIRGAPHGYVSDTFQLLVLRDADDQLFQLHQSPYDVPRQMRRSTTNVSARVGGQLISSNPHVHRTFDDAIHIVARGLNDELLEFWNPFVFSFADWQVVNLSDAVAGGWLIMGARTVMSWMRLSTSWRAVPMMSHWSGTGLDRMAGKCSTYRPPWMDR